MSTPYPTRSSAKASENEFNNVQGCDQSVLTDEHYERPLQRKYGDGVQESYEFNEERYDGPPVPSTRTTRRSMRLERSRRTILILNQMMRQLASFWVPVVAAAVVVEVRCRIALGRRQHLR